MYRVLANLNNGKGFYGSDSNDEAKILSKPPMYGGGLGVTNFNDVIRGRTGETNTSVNTLIVQFTKPKAIKGFIQKSLGSSHFYAVKAVLSYSDDNSNWTELLTKTFNGSTANAYSVNVTKPKGEHKYWKLVVNSYNGEHWQVEFCDFVE